MRAKTNIIHLKKRQWLGISAFILLGLFANVIANENSIIPYSYHSIDTKNRNVSPFENQEVKSTHYRHWLGTDTIGRDVLAGMLAGTRVALTIGFFATLLSILVGIFFAFISSYWGDNLFYIKKILLIPYLLSFIFLIFYLAYGNLITQVICILLFTLITYLFIVKKGVHQQREDSLPLQLDLIVLKIIEILRGIPDLFLVLILLTVIKDTGYINIIIVYALIRWPTVTRYLRAEIMKLKNQNFIINAHARGLSDFTIFSKYILPLAISPVIISSAFGFSGAILLESILSFLGIGIPVDQVSWGSLLTDARQSFDSWWLALFPGLAIYLVVALFNSIGNTLIEQFRGIEKR